MDSNGAWGELAHDTELAELFDKYERLPERGTNAALDAFVDRKHISLDTLVRMGARIEPPNVLVFGFPGGIKYRDVVTDHRWAWTGSTWKELKVVRQGLARSNWVIVAEGETDAARLIELYPTADVAILPGGADPRPYTAAYAHQLNEYGLVLLAQDPDRAGNDGAALLAEQLVAPSMRWTSPEGGDWCELEGKSPPLPPIPEIVRAGDLFFEDLSGVLSGELKPPAELVDDLMYIEGVHFFTGHPESGKTTLAMHAVWQAMQDGRHAVWLDYEGGIHETARRLNDVGIPHELLIERLHYASWPENASAYFGDVAAKWPGAMIAIDSASQALALADLSENLPEDVSKWLSPIVKACKSFSLPIVVIDHVTKSATNAATYSRGGGSKKGLADVMWYVEATEPFNREKAGIVHCKRMKDRYGVLPFDLWYDVGDGAGHLTLTPRDAPLVDQANPTPGSELPRL